MNESEFWEIIEASADSDISIHCGAISARLTDRSPGEITEFADVLAESLFRLDLKILADTPVKGAVSRSGRPLPLSEDGFLYARCAVILAGRKAYGEILTDPAGVDFSPYTSDEAAVAEELLEAAPTAFGRVTGVEWEHVEPFDYETGSNEDGWA
ncbi:DUF4240 domain-containing protein [Streptomyces sp. NPDC021012]|uniref:DUF4240 domain-containing protein n=1 Tax=Streptomyces sp. NPDC021012 TaxID=3365107 RepID=UPI0037AD0FF2